MKINEITNERITRPGDDTDPSFWQRVTNLFKSNSLGTDDRKSRRNKLDDIESRRAEKIRNRNKQDTDIRQRNKVKGAEADQLLHNRHRERDSVEDDIADAIAQDKFGKDHHELDNQDRKNVINTARHLANDLEAYPDLLDDPDYQSDFKKKYPQGLVPHWGKNLDGTDAKTIYHYRNGGEGPNPQYKHPAFKTNYQFDEPGYELNIQKRDRQDNHYTRSQVAKDNNIQFEPRQDIYNLATSQANKERDGRIATGKANIKNIEIKRKLNKATTATPAPVATPTPTPQPVATAPAPTPTIDNTQKKFARDVIKK